MSVRLTWIVAFATAVIALPSNAQQHLTRAKPWRMREQPMRDFRRKS